VPRIVIVPFKAHRRGLPVAEAVPQPVRSGILFGPLSKFATKQNHAVSPDAAHALAVFRTMRSLFLRNAPDLRNISVGASPVITRAAVDPYIHNELFVSLSSCGFFVGFGLDKTDN